jgi:hypothetical protein
MDPETVHSDATDRPLFRITLSIACERAGRNPKARRRDCRPRAAHSSAGKLYRICGKLNQVQVWRWQITCDVLCSARGPTG